jgi:hypothetical protein
MSGGHSDYTGSGGRAEGGLAAVSGCIGSLGVPGRPGNGRARFGVYSPFPPGREGTRCHTAFCPASWRCCPCWAACGDSDPRADAALRRCAGHLRRRRRTVQRSRDARAGHRRPAGPVAGRRHRDDPVGKGRAWRGARKRALDLAPRRRGTSRWREVTIELCDGTPSHVEGPHLDAWIEQVGRYCPWAARLVALGGPAVPLRPGELAPAQVVVARNQVIVPEKGAAILAQQHEPRRPTGLRPGHHACEIGACRSGMPVRVAAVPHELDRIRAARSHQLTETPAAQVVDRPAPRARNAPAPNRKVAAPLDGFGHTGQGGLSRRLPVRLPLRNTGQRRPAG